MQEIYINMDDSGKLSENEDFLVYGGIVFTSLKEKQEFSNKYRNILNSIKCKYCCETKSKCSYDCPETKSSKINDDDRRRIINLCKKYKVFSLVIDRSKVYTSIMSSKASKGRFIDFALKITLKEVLVTLINENVINPKENIKIVINIDQQTTKSNGYYNLRDSIYEEIKHGIINYNYSTFHKPIFNSEVELNVYYIDSKKSIAIQAADMIAGTTRKIMYYKEPRSHRQNRLQTFNWVLKFFP